MSYEQISNLIASNDNLQDGNKILRDLEQISTIFNQYYQAKMNEVNVFKNHSEQVNQDLSVKYNNLKSHYLKRLDQFNEKKNFVNEHNQLNKRIINFKQTLVHYYKINLQIMNLID